MDRWERVGKPAGRRCRDYPSFSSTLLDSIYRSIDESDTRGAPTGGAPDSRRKNAPADLKCAPPVTRPKPPDRRRFVNSTSSSSDGSSYGGFSSSEPESAAHPARLKPIRTAAAGLPSRSDLPPPPPPVASEKKKKPPAASIGSRFRDLRKSRAPASPGARLASFLNSLFATASASQKKPKAAAAAAAARSAPPPLAESPACSSASSYSRSCLSKAPSLRGRPAADGVKRSVRFYPVSVIVDGDLRPCGEKSIYGGDQPAAAIGGYREDDYDDEDGSSDSSSDLFELESLTATGRSYCDELPVYETTHLGTNRAIAQGLIM